MRSSAVLLAAPLAVSAQLSTITGRVQTATIYGTGSASTSALYTTTWTYSNPATAYLTQTNSDGVRLTLARRTSGCGHSIRIPV